jgi:hypothetical protein
VRVAKMMRVANMTCVVEVRHVETGRVVRGG